MTYNSINLKERIEWIDFAKFAAIYFVLWGHAMQYCWSSIVEVHNPVFNFIYSFHMPLFMVLSGYFFYKSIDKPLCKFFKNRLRQLLLPCFSWSLIYCLIILPFKHIDLLYFWKVAYSFWFIWAVMFCSIVSLLSICIFKNKVLAFIISFILILVIPVEGRMINYKLMYPCFWLGYLLQQKKDYLYVLFSNEKNEGSFHFFHWKFLNPTFILLLLFILFYFAIWDIRFSVWNNGMAITLDKNIISQIGIIFINYFLEILGSVSVFFLLRYIFIYRIKKCPNILILIGQSTLGIYIIQSFIWPLLTRIINFSNSTHLLVYSAFYTPIIALLVMIFCYNLILLINKNKFLKFVLLGQKY